MELTRRNFIISIVGGTAGIHATPLPWKLTDDIAIWTQNWPWVPIPPVGAFSHEPSVCGLCPGGCGIEVRKVDERAVKIEGRTDYPTNPGGICPLGAGGLQLLYNESHRFTGPMKRVGPRGSGKFQAVSWDEALKTLADRITGLRQKGRPEALAAIDGNRPQSSMSLLIERLLQAVGSPNYFAIPSMEDSHAAVTKLMHGQEGPMAYDLENADFILSFGCGLLEGWGAPGRVFNTWGFWRGESPGKKTKIVQIESRASNTASKADQWIAPFPGTETALALGLAHVMIREGLYNRAFVENYCHGFEDGSTPAGGPRKGFKSMVLERYSPDAVARVTGLNAADIKALAKAFASADAPIALSGKGKGYLNGSLMECMAVQCLNALSGNINQPGGVLVQPPLPLSPWPDVEKDGIADEGLMKPRLDLTDHQAMSLTNGLTGNLSMTLAEGPESSLDTLLVFSSNPVFTLPDSRRFKRGLKKIPFIVSFSPYRDETAYMADLILPDHTYLEKMDDVVWPSGLQYPLYGLAKPVVEPLYDTRHSGDVVIKLAKSMGGTVKASFPWKRYEETLKARAQGLFESGQGGLTRFDDSRPVWKRLSQGQDVKPDYKSFKELWKKIKSGGMWYRPAHDFGNWNAIFKTPSGKFEFFSSEIEQTVSRLAESQDPKAALKGLGLTVGLDEACMPHYEPSLSGGMGNMVMVPYEMINLSSGWLPNPPYLNKTLLENQLLKGESFVEINPETASRYGLGEGDRVLIQSEKGEVKARVHLFDGAMPQVVYLPLGLGRSAYDDFQQGKGVNPFELFDGTKDPLSGFPIWWNTRVQLKKI